jgi:hypothetical protein
VNAPLTVASDWIGELCIALAHRWEPERLFVLFTAYFDEADTHGPAPTVILAAYVGHAYQWRRFEQKLACLQRKHGFSIFHAKDFKAKAGEFSGWTDNQCMNLIDDLTELTGSDLTEGLAVSLEYSRYMKEYRAPPIPKKMNLDSQLGACFRGCLGRLLKRLELLGRRKNRDRLNVVIERGHKNVWDCERIFDDLRKRFLRLDADILGSFTVAAKETCPPLMVADSLAATHSMIRTRLARGSLNEDDIVYDPKKNPHKAPLVFLELAPDALRDLKLNFEKLRQLEIEEWRAKRAAKRSSSSAGQFS